MIDLNAMSKDELHQWVVGLLADMFELDVSEVTPTTNLYEDLDIDSIDAVDLAVKLKQLTGKRMGPETFKTIRTIDDVVMALQGLATAEAA